jgi:hypothetical protein
MQPDLDALNGETAADPNKQAAGNAEARIKLLLDEGPLAEAEEVCKQALARFPDWDRLRALQSDIQQKETAIRELLEQGEERLGERDFEAAAEFFTAACHLLPLDDELADHIVGLLHQHAQDALEKDWEAADASLKLVARIQPGGLASPFLADALEGRKHEAAAEAEASHGEMLRGAGGRSAAMSRTRAAVIALAALAVLGAISLFGWKSLRAHFAHPAHQPPATVAAATGRLIIRTNIPNAEIFINNQKYATTSGGKPLEIPLRPDTYRIRAIHPGYTDYGPVAAAVTKGHELALDLQLDPKPAMLKIQGAEPGTEIRVDGVLVGAVAAGVGVTGQLSPGLHAVELSREGFLSKKIVLQLSPGEKTVLRGSDVALHSSDASERSLDPTAPQVDLAEQEESGAFADVLPNIPDQAAAAQAEQNDWAALDKSNKAALEAFAGKHQTSPHAEEAAGLIAGLDRQAAAAQLQRADETAWKSVTLDDRHSIDAYLDQFTAGAHRGEAEQALANLRSAELLKADTAAIRRADRPVRECLEREGFGFYSRDGRRPQSTGIKNATHARKNNCHGDFAIVASSDHGHAGEYCVPAASR